MLGLSPRGRGKPPTISTLTRSERSIPAWAGETVRRALRRDSRWVYPRVGGGNIPEITLFLRDGGLSPRGRGKRLALRPARCPRRSIPAWAGETILRARRHPFGAVYPRVGGGNSILQYEKGSCAGLSPRGRGKPLPYALNLVEPRSIPAWAGETLCGQADQRRVRVYPRVGGGNGVFANPSRRAQGLSPRGRGKPARL